MKFELTRETWQLFKKNNDISKSSAFNRADVGPHIDSFWKARDQYKAAKTWTNINTLIKKLTDLQAAFAKFRDLKEAKGQLNDVARAQLTKWHDQLEEAVAKLRLKKTESTGELKAEDARDMDGKLTECGI
jgi:hypothetical protein